MAARLLIPQPDIDDEILPPEEELASPRALDEDLAEW